MVIVHCAILGNYCLLTSSGDIGEPSLYWYPLTTKTLANPHEPSGRQKVSALSKAQNTKMEKFQPNLEYTSKQLLAPPTNISCFLKNLRIFLPNIVTRVLWSAKRGLTSWLSKVLNYQTPQGLTSTMVNTATSFLDLGLC